jgi:hypothetical protein
MGNPRIGKAAPTRGLAKRGMHAWALSGAHLLAATLFIHQVAWAAEDSDDAVLQADYAVRANGMSQTELLLKSGAFVTTVGFVAGLAPATIHTGHHVADLAIDGVVLVVDAAILVYMSHRLVYLTGAIMSKNAACPHLVETGDFEKVLGVLFGGADKQKLLFIAGKSIQSADTLSALARRRVAAQAFQRAVVETAPEYLGGRATERLLRNFAIKGMTGKVPWLGGVIGALINGFAIREVEQAAVTYYEVKAQLICAR